MLGDTWYNKAIDALGSITQSAFSLIEEKQGQAARDQKFFAEGMENALSILKDYRDN